MMIHSFTFAPTPLIHFGVGKLSLLSQAVKTYGSKVLVVTGTHSFTSTPYWIKIQEDFTDHNITWFHHILPREPSPQMIDDCVRKYKGNFIDVIVAIGGGSVMDAGKAISAMLVKNEPVKMYVEGVGTNEHNGSKLPFIALPTTSGTGSEATKNAVLSEIGVAGYKRSLRHNNFVPNIAIIDPSLTLNCPSDITAQSGMDAFTQLLESYLSTSSSPMTDSLAIKGLFFIKESLLKAYENNADIYARTGMAYASLISGITLANSGLGVVHGFASSLGGYFDIPHGVICGTLMGATNRITLNKLLKSQEGDLALNKYAEVGKLFLGEEGKSKSYYYHYIITLIDEYTERLQIPRLSQYGLTLNNLSIIAKSTENKNNPSKLNIEELTEILEERL